MMFNNDLIDDAWLDDDCGLMKFSWFDRFNDDFVVF